MMNSPNSLRVCLVPLTYNVSGTEGIVRDIALRISQNRYAVDLLVPCNPSLDDYANDIRKKSDQIQVQRIDNVAKNVGVVQRLNNVLSSFRYFQKSKPDYVHFHCPSSRWGLEVILAAGIARVPNIIRTEHNPLLEKPTGMYQRLLSITDAKVKQFTYVSRRNGERFETYLPNRVGRGKIIPNGVDTDRFYPDTNEAKRKELRNLFGWENDVKIAVYVGGYGGRRSLVPIFEAFRSILANSFVEAKRWRVLIIGEGSENEKNQILSSDAKEYFRFAGKMSNIHQILPRCDLFVTASQFEGLSIAMLEAWSSGLPVLTTTVDGVSDVLGDELARTESVPQGDVPGFASAWTDYIRGSDRRNKYQQYATSQVRESFTREKMLDLYANLYT